MWVGHWAVLLFLIVVPGCASLFDVGAHDMARIAQIIVCTLAALAIWWRAAIGQSEKRLDSALAVALGVGVFVALLSVWHASDSTAAMRELALLLGLFSIAAVVGCSCRRDALEVMAVVVAAAALLNAGLVLTLMLGTVLQLNRLDLFTVVPGYDNPRFLNHVQTVMLPLSAIAASPSFRRGEFSRLG